MWTTHFLGSPFNPLPTVLFRNPTPDLHAPLPRTQRRSCRFFVSWAEHNHMRPSQFMFLVEFGVVGGGVLGGEVCLEVGGDGGEGAADNLLDGTSVQVYAGAETRHCGVVDK
jgi:hypothetical protein